MFARGDKNPLTYYRQVTDVKRLVVDLGGTLGQTVERAWIDHLLNELTEVGLGLSVVETVLSPSNGITFCPGSLATNRGNDVLAIA